MSGARRATVVIPGSLPESLTAVLPVGSAGCAADDAVTIRPTVAGGRPACGAQPSAPRSPLSDSFSVQVSTTQGMIAMQQEARIRRQRAISQLVQEAEALQTRTNEFIGRATMARVELPGVVYETNAELLRLPDVLRDMARRVDGQPSDQAAFDGE
jgi:hypothetical protein